ncbi:GNAT family N-acetyltransferase [Hyphomonas sediminis]|uniref:GNAT family N-acetyltransferase n=1 Tax=Hyphomonas sediminis TaxID=2866160 RepID=UPI001CED7C40|nr:GNAT family N-acetyltransferase [Hyphomonas sediminis]
MIVRPLTGADLEQALPALARLRIDVFSAFPYLYSGTEEYEQKYLRSFAAARDAFIVAAEEDGQIVGCATGSAIDDHHGKFAAPLKAAGYDLPSTFYFGESVLRPGFRGRSLGHAFFDAREAHAQERGYVRACFCAVARAKDHPRRPEDYSPLDTFWEKRGYRKLSGITTDFAWPTDPGGPDLIHPMNYWMRSF